jgi:shikimate kinase
MLIFLIGMMGSGKTTLGKQLAQQLGYAFIDLDAFIEQQENTTITIIFETQGQDKFRQLERKALETLVQANSKAVIATGGGAPCFFDNIDFMNRAGETVFLDVPIKQLAERLQATDLTLRPLLTGKPEQEIISYLSATLTHRKQFYERAKYKVQGGHITAQHLMQILNNY